MNTIKGGGAFTRKNIDDINANFTSLENSGAGGTLASAHLIVGNASNVATDTAITGDVSVSNAGVTSVAGGITTHKLVAAPSAGVSVVGGVTALDGSNPTTIATGLTTIVGFSATVNRSTSLATGTAFVTYNNISGGSVDVYGWVVAGTASSGTENIAWTAIGT